MQTKSLPARTGTASDRAPLPLRHVLATYTSSHPLRSPSPLPPSSRVDPKLAQKQAPPSASSPLLWTIPTWIVFARFALAKGLHIIWSLLSHFLFGPQRPSWGYRMTLITSFMRNVAEHTNLADIILVRRLISLHQLIPLPADAVVTPITFTVPLRTGEGLARGFLRDLDGMETGTRELTGEWVVGTDVWKRLKGDRRARQEAERKRRKSRRASGLSPGGASADATPTAGAQLGHPRTLSGSSVQDTVQRRAVLEGLRGRHSPDIDSDTESTASTRRAPSGERVIYYIHGGAYYVGNAATHRLITIGISKACNARVFAITYRLAPEHPFPLPLHDVLHGYLRLLAPPLSIPPENIVIMGDSAGGGLSLALCMYLRDEGYKSPAGLVLMSPWVDLTMSCGSWDENGGTDVVPQPKADDHLNPVGCYLGPDGISKYITHPYASPLFGDLSGLPPMLIQSGDSEVLRDEITLLAHKATLYGDDITHELYEDMVHVFQTFTWLPAAKAAIASIGRWVQVTLPKIEEARQGSKEAGALGNKAADGMADEMEADPHTVERHADVGDRLAEGVRDVFAAGAASWSSRTNGLGLDFNDRQSRKGSDIDLAQTPRSGSPTPTPSRAMSPASRPTAALSSQRHTDVPPPRAPRLRRSVTSLASVSSSQVSLTSAASPAAHTVRRRRPTASFHTSSYPYPWSPPGPSSPRSVGHARAPSGSSFSYFPSHPSSPTPSSRRRLRSPTLTQTPPSLRERSQSHSDIHFLVEGYVEGGAANETTVYAPGGEIKSVGVLGDLEDGDDGA